MGKATKANRQQVARFSTGRSGKRTIDGGIPDSFSFSSADEWPSWVSGQLRNGCIVLSDDKPPVCKARLIAEKLGTSDRHGRFTVLIQHVQGPESKAGSLVGMDIGSRTGRPSL